MTLLTSLPIVMNHRLWIQLFSLQPGGFGKDNKCIPHTNHELVSHGFPLWLFSILGRPGGQINRAGGQIKPPQDLLGNSHMCFFWHFVCIHILSKFKETQWILGILPYSSTLAMLRPQLSGVGEVGCVVGSIAAVPKRSQQFPDHDETNPDPLITQRYTKDM